MYSTTQSIMLPNARHHSLYPFLLEIEECEDCYQKDQDEDNEELEKPSNKNQCDFCAGGQNTTRHPNTYGCAEFFCGLEEAKEKTGVKN